MKNHEKIIKKKSKIKLLEKIMDKNAENQTKTMNKC